MKCAATVMQNFRFEIGKIPFGFMSCPLDHKTILYRFNAPSHLQ